jgi:hypothetical protein
MIFKEELERLRTEVLLKRFPDNDAEWCNKFWYASSIKYDKGRSAPKVEKNIVEYLQLLGHQAEKISVTGRSIDNTKKVKDVIGRERMIGSRTYIPSTSTKGSADISATVYGLALKIEVKVGKDRQSANQKKYEQNINQAGGVYMIAHHEQDFLDKFNEFLLLPQVQLLKEF